jgi:UV DNA damage endonuclease
MPELGLVCLTESDAVRYRTITRTRLLALDEPARERTLVDLFCENLRRLAAAAVYCKDHRIALYRLPTGLLPFSDHESGRGLVRRPEVVHEMRAAKRTLRSAGIRVVSHPDQFVVLSSQRDDVVRNSIAVLTREADLMDALGLPRTPAAAMILHGGKAGRAEELIATIRTLPPGVKSRLVLENDERAYGAADILQICKRAKVPMVFDAHHHVVKEQLDSYDDAGIARYTSAAAATWPDPQQQLVHISNGRDGFLDRRHSDTIAVMPKAFRRVPYIEVEAKAKERALFALREWFPRRTSRPPAR